MIGMLQILAGIAIVFFLPGYTLVSVLFPRKGELDPDYDVVYRVALGMGLSVVIAILIGFALNAMSTEDRGLVTAGPLWLAFLSVTGAFFALGWLRGAYPWMGRLHPILYRDPPPRRIDGVRLSPARNERRISSLVLERERLLRERTRCADRLENASAKGMEYYRSRIEGLGRAIDEANAELARLQEVADDGG